MNHQKAVEAAREWVAMREVWSEVAPKDRAVALKSFYLPEDDLMNLSFDQIVAAYHETYGEYASV